MNKLYNILTNEKYQKIFLVVFLLVTFIGLHQGIRFYMESTTHRIVSKIDLFDLQQDKIIESPVRYDTIYNNKLKYQYYSSKYLKKYFMELAIIFNENYYKFSICFIVSSILLSISLFLIVQKGWSNSSFFIKEFFLLSVFISSIYYFLPIVLNSQDNIRQNIEKVKIYQGIQLDILSYQNIFDSLNRTQRDTVITNINNRIKNDYDFLISIDPSKVNISPLESIKELSN